MKERDAPVYDIRVEHERNLDEARRDLERSLSRNVSAHKSLSRNVSAHKDNYLDRVPSHSLHTNTLAERNLERSASKYRSRSNFKDESPVRSTTSARKLLYSDESAYSNLLVETLIKDTKIEDLRLRLTSYSDFNLYDAYLLFERHNRSFVDIADIQYGLERLGTSLP